MLNTKINKIYFITSFKLQFVENIHNCHKNSNPGVWSHITLSKTNPPTAVLSTQIKLYCYGMDYRFTAGASGAGDIPDAGFGFSNR